MSTGRWLNAFRNWRSILWERYQRSFSAPSPPGPWSWPLTDEDKSGLMVRWPTDYQGNHSPIWTRPLLLGLRRHVRLEYGPVPQPYPGALVLQLVKGGASHDVIIDYMDDVAIIRRDLLSRALLYFKMQYRREGYGDERVLPGGYICACSEYYNYLRWLRSVKDRQPPRFEVYGRFGPQFAASVRRQAVDLLKAQDRFRYEGSLGIVRYSHSLEEAARAQVCIDLPGNGPFCFRLVDYFGIGACVIAAPHHGVLHVPLEDRKHIVYAREDLADLVDLCRHYLEHAEERDRLVRNSREYFDRYLHREQLTAYYLAKALERLRQLG